MSATLNFQIFSGHGIRLESKRIQSAKNQSEIFANIIKIRSAKMSVFTINVCLATWKVVVPVHFFSRFSVGVGVHHAWPFVCCFLQRIDYIIHFKVFLLLNAKAICILFRETVSNQAKEILEFILLPPHLCFFDSIWIQLVMLKFADCACIHTKTSFYKSKNTFSHGCVMQLRSTTNSTMYSPGDWITPPQ